MYHHAPGTIYRRAVKRTGRRALAYSRVEAALRAGSTSRLDWQDRAAATVEWQLLRESVRLANALAICAYGSPVVAATTLLHRSVA